MSKKEPLKIGEKVRVKDIDQTDGRACSDTGEVIAISSDAVKVKYRHWKNNVDADGEAGTWIFPRQCVRLRKKPSPPAKGERVEMFALLNILGSNLVYAWNPKREELEKIADGMPIIRMAQVRPGEIILDREKLERAWDTHIFKQLPNAKECWTFTTLCKALGLEGSAK